MNIITVSQLNAFIAFKFKDEEHLQSVNVSGEISNFVNHRKSGHYYFTLKDSNSSLKCVMFKSDTLFLRFTPENGQQVVIKGSVQVFERDGVYQLYARDMEQQGVGDLYAEYEKLKQKLADGGYFDRKRPIPVPKKICIITAKTGAALQDMLNVLERRYPLLEVVLISALVQGKDAPMSLVSAITAAQSTGADVIIIGRGGGSIEDLWAFNDERVALAVYDSKIPTISAVGHETDFTICDFTADLRAPTPSAAAELAVPDITIIRRQLDDYDLFLKRYIKKYLEDKISKLAYITGEINQKSPLFRLKAENEKLNLIENQIKTRIKSFFLEKENSLKSIADIISALSPTNVLMRGYAIAFDLEGNVLKKAEKALVGDTLRLRLQNGELLVNVKDYIKGE